jgi:hypothetical protein
MKRYIKEKSCFSSSNYQQDMKMEAVDESFAAAESFCYGLDIITAAEMSN